MKTIFFDTNAYSNFKRGDTTVLNAVKNCDILYISVVTVGELYSGFYQGTKFKLNEKELDIFLTNRHVKVINILPKTSKIYGEIYSKLFKNGTPIPTNDVWIAASVIQVESSLITYDKHFLKIPILKVWDELKKR